MQPRAGLPVRQANSSDGDYQRGGIVFEDLDGEAEAIQDGCFTHTWRQFRLGMSAPSYVKSSIARSRSAEYCRDSPRDSRSASSGSAAEIPFAFSGWPSRSRAKRSATYKAVEASKDV